MDLIKLSGQIFKIKAVLFAICIVIVLLLLDDKGKALGVALVFMCLSTLGDIVLGYYKNKAGLGFASALLVPIIMFSVFLFLSVIMFLNLQKA